MAESSDIEWTDATWNVVTGCTKVSPGCDHCYAETFANRWRGKPGHPFEAGFAVTLRPERTRLPLAWRRPRRIFVTSMGDLFHDQVPDQLIAECFAVMAAGHWHTFQVLTKRHARMRSLVGSDQFRRMVCDEYAALRREGAAGPDPADCWPLPNVWVGVSAETQQWADLRLPALAATPAAVRFVSCEPLLGPVNLSRWLGIEFSDMGIWLPEMLATVSGRQPALDWLIVGGESGPGARAAEEWWIGDLVAQANAANRPVFVKQLGAGWARSHGHTGKGNDPSQPTRISPPAAPPTTPAAPTSWRPYAGVTANHPEKLASPDCQRDHLPSKLADHAGQNPSRRRPRRHAVTRTRVTDSRATACHPVDKPTAGVRGTPVGEASTMTQDKARKRAARRRAAATGESYTRAARLTATARIEVIPLATPATAQITATTRWGVVERTPVGYQVSVAPTQALALQKAAACTPARVDYTTPGSWEPATADLLPVVWQRGDGRWIWAVNGWALDDPGDIAAAPPQAPPSQALPHEVRTFWDAAGRTWGVDYWGSQPDWSTRCWCETEDMARIIAQATVRWADGARRAQVWTSGALTAAFDAPLDRPHRPIRPMDTPLSQPRPDSPRPAAVPLQAGSSRLDIHLRIFHEAHGWNSAGWYTMRQMAAVTASELAVGIDGHPYTFADVWGPPRFDADLPKRALFDRFPDGPRNEPRPPTLVTMTHPYPQFVSVNCDSENQRDHPTCTWGGCECPCHQPTIGVICGACRDGACPIISGDGEHQGHVCISTDENCTQHVCACGEEWGDLL